MSNYLFIGLFSTLIPLMLGMLVVPALRHAATFDKPNPFFGYRTPATLKNVENWKLGNKLAAKYFEVLNVWFAAFTFIVFGLVWNWNGYTHCTLNWVTMFMFLAWSLGVVAIIAKVEAALGGSLK